MITDDDLNRWEELSRAATPGPYFFAYRSVHSQPLVDEYHRIERTIPEDAPEDAYEVLPGTAVAFVPVVGGDTATQQGLADGTFFAEARTAVPDLCAEVRRWRQEARHFARLAKEGAVDKVIAERDALRAELAAAAAANLAFNVKAAQEINEARAQRDTLQRRYEECSAKNERLVSELTGVASERDALRAEVEQMKVERAAIQRAAYDATAEASELKRQVEHRDARLDDAREEASELRAEGEAARKHRDAERDEEDARRRELEAEASELRACLADAAGKIEVMRAENERLRSMQPVVEAVRAMIPDLDDTSGSMSRVDAMNEHVETIAAELDIMDSGFTKRRLMVRDATLLHSEEPTDD